MLRVEAVSALLRQVGAVEREGAWDGLGDVMIAKAELVSVRVVRRRVPEKPCHGRAAYVLLLAEHVEEVWRRFGFGGTGGPGRLAEGRLQRINSSWERSWDFGQGV